MSFASRWLVWRETFLGGGVVYWTWHKRKKRLEAEFGTTPDVYYSDGAMEYIRAYFDYRREREPERYCVDEITWNDLDMDRVFVRLNPGLSTPGEQWLYDTLRHPALERQDYERRKHLIQLMEQNPEKRLRIQKILSRLGRVRRADLCTAFQPQYRGKGRLILYLALVSALLVLAVLTCVTHVSRLILAAVALLACNATLREYTLRRIRLDFDTVNYDVSMVFALHAIQKLGFQPLDQQLEESNKALEKLRFILRTGPVTENVDSV